jgi:nucleotide-binding universal stress UspA family protein
MMRIRNLVVGVASLTDDDPAVSPPGEDPVLAPAVELARRLGATLHVVHAFELPEPVLAASAAAAPFNDPSLPLRLALDARAVLERRVERFGYPAIRCHVREGSPARVIREVAARVDAGLVVVGATRRGKAWRNLLGSTAERVVRTSPVPVLVMHQPFARPVRRLLVATDLSDAGAALLDRGIRAADALFGDALEVRGVTVVALGIPLPPPLREDSVRRAAAEGLRRFLDARPGGKAMEAKVRFGEVAREIAREAEEWGADLVVLGAYGRGGFSRFLLGSNAMATLRGLGCNALVVPGTERSARHHRRAPVTLSEEDVLAHLPALAM